MAPEPSADNPTNCTMLTTVVDSCPGRYIGGPLQQRTQIMPYIARFRLWAKSLPLMPWIQRRSATGVRQKVLLFVDWMETHTGSGITMDDEPEASIVTPTATAVSAMPGGIERPGDPGRAITVDTHCTTRETGKRPHQAIKSPRPSSSPSNEPRMMLPSKVLDTRGRVSVYIAPSRSDRDPLLQKAASTLPTTLQQQMLIHGNLCLSSCPGKKVRLTTGPVDGRAAVCRDLESDFERIASAGVQTVVCCLCDEELMLLGAPFNEYLDAAHAWGITVIRIPIVEGKTPLCLMDMVLVLDEIDSRIAAGTHALCHCRGGIGRAGLVACCYMLYKGYCDTAEDAITYIRRRRSHKAIETEEQESYIEYFRQMLHSFRDEYRKDPRL
ncbi:hypothetical protein BSLG_010530 [Batrachochytrium salamandrivorans]|nr:hypothetical protein BSLG_010530 [Batrachochytrium salamandrivorans]